MNNIRWHNVRSMNLGGNPARFIYVSKDYQSDWPNNIFHNSRYAIFSLNEGKLELLSKDRDLPKFRKCAISSVEKALEKIDQWAK